MEENANLLRKEFTINNKLGLHARAAAKVVHAASEFESKIYLGIDGEEVNAKSILGLLTLAATQGTPLTLRVDGPDDPTERRPGKTRTTGQ